MNISIVVAKFFLMTCMNPKTISLFLLTPFLNMFCYLLHIKMALYNLHILIAVTHYSDELSFSYMSLFGFLAYQEFHSDLARSMKLH
ncbi:hypothetical protein COE86_04225 [Bacillus toyonensis]|nr:hypothetical protein COE86_04225 [Bacillus toyonensis]